MGVGYTRYVHDAHKIVHLLANMLLGMTLKRYNIGFHPQQQKLLQRLSAKWGLDITNTLRHCVARVAEQEGLSADGGKREPSERPRTK